MPHRRLTYGPDLPERDHGSIRLRQREYRLERPVSGRKRTGASQPIPHLPDRRAGHEFILPERDRGLIR